MKRAVFLFVNYDRSISLAHQYTQLINRVNLGVKAWSVLAAKLLDFTAGIYVPGPSKLATFAIVIL